MSQNAAAAFVAATGSIYSFAEGTPVEYGANAPLPVGVVDHGLASDEGIKYGPNRSVTTIRAWQNAQIIRSLVTEADFTVTVTLVQVLDDANKELAHGTKKNATTGGYHINPANTGGIRSFDLRSIDTARRKVKRLWIPAGEVTEVGETTWVSSNVVMMPLTITTYAVSIEGEEANAIEWDGEWTPGSGQQTPGNGGGDNPLDETPGDGETPGDTTTQPANSIAVTFPGADYSVGLSNDPTRTVNFYTTENSINVTGVYNPQGQQLALQLSVSLFDGVFPGAFRFEMTDGYSGNYPSIDVSNAPVKFISFEEII